MARARREMPMPMWTSDFFSSPTVALMATVEIGAYCLLLLRQWQAEGAGLPNDIEILRKLARVGRRFDLSRVLSKFETGEDGKLYNRKLHDQWINDCEFRVRQSEKGRKGGRPEKPGLSSGLHPDKAGGKPQEEGEEEEDSLFPLSDTKLLSGAEVSQAETRSLARAELAWRAEEVWRVHADAWREYRTRRDGYPPGGRQEKALESAKRVTLPLILDAIKRHDGALLGAEQRERWGEESVVRAAGIGIFHDPWCTAQDARNRRGEGGTEYLEHWRPWKVQKAKADPVPRFAELYFASLETWERRRGA